MPHDKEMPFPVHSGHMAAQIRSLEWKETAIGAIETWPVSLKLAIEWVLAAGHPMVLTWGAAFTVAAYNDVFEALTQKTGLSAVLGHPFPESWHQFRDRLSDQFARVWSGEPGPLHDVFLPTQHQGSRENTGFDLTVSPVRDEHGAISGILCLASPITETATRIEVAQKLRQSRQRLSTLVEGIPQLVWRGTRGGLWTWSSPQWQSFTGLSAGDSLELGWLRAVHPEDRSKTLIAWAEANEPGLLSIEHRLRHADSRSYRWFQTRAKPVRDEAGTIVEWLGTSTDVHDLRRLQEAQSLLVAELQHRTRNLLTVVQSIAEQTMVSSPDFTVFKEKFVKRLGALSRVQGLLSRADHEPVTIAKLIGMELDALFDDTMRERVFVAGPTVQLRPSTVQILALAIHELATNARKYGALSTGHGRLEITWDVSTTSTGIRRLALSWIESGVCVGHRPRTGAPPGFGRQLIERGLTYSLDAETAYALTPDGVHCRIDLPLPQQNGREVDPGRTG